MKAPKKDITFIRVKRNSKVYRVYLKDLKALIMRPKPINRPKVPIFS